MYLLNLAKQAIILHKIVIFKIEIMFESSQDIYANPYAIDVFPMRL